MGGGIEPGLNGTIESIKSIKIIDSNGNDISSLFHNLTIEDKDCNIQIERFFKTTQHIWNTDKFYIWHQKQRKS